MKTRQTVEPSRPSWRQRLMTWFRLKKLEHELRSNKNFQKECEKIHCFILAELTEKDQINLREKIRKLKTSQTNVLPPEKRHEPVTENLPQTEVERVAQ